MIDILICAFFIIIFWLQDCVRADVPLLLSVQTDVLTPVGGDCGKGGVALRGCALLLSLPFFPPSRPSFQPVVRPSQPVRPPASPHTGLRYFYFFASIPARTSSHLTYRPATYLLQLSLTFFSVLHHGLPPVKRVFRRWLPRRTVLATILAKWT